MPGTSVSLTSLIATTLHGPEMALGQRPENSMAANTLYTCLTLHNVLEWITDRLVWCVELYLQYSLIGYKHAVGQQKMSCSDIMQHFIFHLPTQQVWTKCSCVHCCSLHRGLLCYVSYTCVCAWERENECVCICTASLMCWQAADVCQPGHTADGGHSWCWKGQGQTLRSQFTRKEPTKKGQVDTLLHSVRKTWAL